MKLTEFKVMTFDVVGTLIDFETGVLNAVRALGGEKAAAASDDEIFEPYKRGRDKFYGRSS
ncbi:MAG TPA: HAD family hydrolase, partial [Rhizobium sp.]